MHVWALLSFISFHILLAKAFIILFVCLVVRNNSCGNSSSWKFFLFIFDIVPVLAFAADLSLFNFVFVSSTLAYWLFVIICNTVPWENFNLVSSNFSKIVNRKIRKIIVWNFLLSNKFCLTCLSLATWFY